MAKKSGKSKKIRKTKSESGNLQAAEILKQIKIHWKNREWEKALVSYRTWCNRTGGKRDSEIEGELLFRIASTFFRDRQFQKAVSHLQDSEKKNPDNRRNTEYCRGIALARAGRLEDSRQIFSDLNKPFHRDIVDYFLEKEKTIPVSVFWDPAFPENIIQEFWRTLANPDETKTSSSALIGLKKAYGIYSSGENPAARLSSLEKKDGFKDMAVYLQLLAAVSSGSYIRVRNLLQKSPDVISGGKGNRLLDLYLENLLEQKKYREIIVLDRIFRGIKVIPPSHESVLNTALFFHGIEEIEKGKLENARVLYDRITEETPNVLHNKALINQKSGNFLKANEYWTRLWGKTRKPKRSDSKNLKESYAVMLKFIAENYRREDLSGKAVPIYREVLTLVENDRESLEALQEIYAENGNQQLSVNYAKRLFEMERGNEEYLYNYTSALFELQSFDELIPLYEEACKGKPESLFYRESLEFCYTRKALGLRQQNLDELKTLLEKINTLSDMESSHVLYLKGYLFHREGYPRKAMRKINRAMEMADDHYHAYALACVLHEDGFIIQAMKLFQEIASCGCLLSEELTDAAVGFLAEKNEKENVLLLCSIAENSLQWDNYYIADMLYFYKQPTWALAFSLKLINKETADEEDRYLHLLILNSIGNGRDTLQYARELLEKARNEDDSDDAYIMKSIIKEIKGRGRFKPPFEDE